MKYINLADCVQVNFDTFGNFSKYQKNQFKKFLRNYNSELLQLTPRIYSKIFMVVWDKLYKLDIINKYKIKFPEGRIFEDNFFTYSYLSHCKNIYWINKKLYIYRSSPNSILKKNITEHNKKENDILKNIAQLIKHLKKYGLFEKIQKAVKIISLKINTEKILNTNTKIRKELKIIENKKDVNKSSLCIHIINKTENKNVTPTVYKKLIHFENAEWIEDLFGNGLVIQTPLKTFETDLKIPNDGIFEFQFNKLNLNEKQTLQLTSIKINDKELLETKVLAPYMLRLKLEKGQPVNLKVSYEVKKFNLNKNRPLIQIQCAQDNNIKITPTKGLEVRNFNYPDDILDQKLIDVIPVKRKNKFTIHNPDRQSLLINFVSTLPQNIYYKYIKINGINFSQNYIQANFQNPLSISTGNDENITLEFAYSRHKWF